MEIKINSNILKIENVSFTLVTLKARIGCFVTVLFTGYQLIAKVNIACQEMV
jgi:hypothetical protein